MCIGKIKVMVLKCFSIWVIPLLVYKLKYSWLKAIWTLCQVNVKILGRLHQVQRLTRRLRKERRYIWVYLLYYILLNTINKTTVSCYRKMREDLNAFQVSYEDSGFIWRWLQDRTAHHPTGGKTENACVPNNCCLFLYVHFFTASNFDFKLICGTEHSAFINGTLASVSSVNMYIYIGCHYFGN